MGSIETAKEVAAELPPFFRVFKDGSVERFIGAPTVPPTPEDPETGVSSKDITISKEPPISARLYLPKLTQPPEQKKLPILVYFHGGGFCIESAYSSTETKYMNSLVSQAKVVAISIEYRLAPESPLPIAFEDCWTALQWVASHHSSTENELEEKEEWIINHGDFNRFFIGGDSAGANIAHNIAMRIGSEGMKNDVKLLGFYLTHPYFWGSKAIGSEPDIDREQILPHRVWSFLYPSVAGGIDSPMMNPAADGAPSLAGLPGCRLLISVSEKDELRDRGVLYYKSVKESGWKGEVELIEVEGEGHAFHILQFGTENANNLILRLASFLLKST
ncbi:2-hydroxyisoflavanone dehydratase-like [Euphorbia lathyris]|uniref:2-hydroxyisoflavanone dehydratase-like n=1 Tax=Euphorbia lathyris TaxID=212925 RepID=UPI0033130B40